MKKYVVALFAVLLLAFEVPAQSLGADPVKAEPQVEQVAKQGPTQEAQVIPGPTKAVVNGPSVDTTGVGQGPFTGGSINLADMIEWFHALYGALVLLLGFVVKGFKLPGTLLDRVPTFLRVVAAGAILAAAFTMVGWKGTLPYIFSFLAATGIYNLFQSVNKIFKR